MRKIILSVVAATVVLTTSSLAAEKVYATVNGTNITSSDIAMVIRNPRIDFSKLPAITQKKVLNQAIDSKLLAKLAIKDGIEKTQAFKNALAKLKNDLALETWMKEKYNQAKVPDKEAKKFYTENPSKFIQPPEVEARHILLKTKKQAEAVIAQLKGLSGKKLEKKFIELAKTKSVGPTGKNGGQLGWFPKNRMVPPFANAAFALKKGQYTKTPVKTQFGYHVIYVEAKRGGKEVSFANVKNRIKSQLKIVEFQKNVRAIAKKLRAHAKVKIF